MSLLQSLIIVSEKAGNIARICRQEKHLFELLVQEKDAEESNPRFVQDFKTLADVLIQETVKYEIGEKFPSLKNQIKGEESNTFCNKLGDVLRVEIQNDVDETAKLLETVLNGDTNAAKLLADEVHRNVKLEDVNLCCNDLSPIESKELDYNNLGIWIDPIDSTAEYISGKEENRRASETEISVTGLGCVTVLIGVYNKSNGTPLMGIVNQPFFKINNDKWRGRCHWGLSNASCLSCNCKFSTKSTKLICISNSENQVIKELLENKGFKLVEAAGAGYKLLTVITGLADAYVLSKDTTFKWDTCGPQAILKSLGGNIVNLQNLLKDQTTPVTYADVHEDTNEAKLVKCCNVGGIVAYKNEFIVNEIIDALKDFDKL